MIQKISWVRNATVLRRMPNTIHVILEEYQPYALWQYKGDVVVIGDNGTILTDDLNENFKNLIILTGENAPVRAIELIELLKAEPVILDYVEAASLISDRRWDLKLRNAQSVSLPEVDIGFALRRLAQAQEEDSIFEKNIAHIDLRETDRIIVKER